MYVSYTTQKVLHEDRVRELLADQQPHESLVGRRVSSLVSSLRTALSGRNEPTRLHPVETQNCCPAE